MANPDQPWAGSSVADVHSRRSGNGRAMRVGMLVGACAALWWTWDILGFARRPIETDELGLYQLFALAHCLFCLVMFPAVVFAGAVAGRLVGRLIHRIRSRSSPER